MQSRQCPARSRDQRGSCRGRESDGARGRKKRPVRSPRHDPIQSGLAPIIAPTARGRRLTAHRADHHPCAEFAVHKETTTALCVARPRAASAQSPPHSARRPGAAPSGASSPASAAFATHRAGVAVDAEALRRSRAGVGSLRSRSSRCCHRAALTFGGSASAEFSFGPHPKTSRLLSSRGSAILLKLD
jgi:hypothetical protein